MSIETLLTLAVAGGILVLLGLLRLTVALGVRAVRNASGRPVPEGPRLAESVARRSWAERGKRLSHGLASIAIVIVATIVTWLRALAAGLGRGGSAVIRGSRAGGAAAGRWWRGAGKPALEETREAALALMTERPEESGRPDLMHRTLPVLERSAFTPYRHRAKRAEDVQLV